MRLVILESPYNGATPEEIALNVEYAKKCIRHCLSLNEAPIASHLLFTQPGILLDSVPEERKLGIEAGLAWLRVAEASVVYTDRGISPGMINGISSAEALNVPVEFRTLPGYTKE